MLTQKNLEERRVAVFEKDPDIYDHIADFEDKLKRDCPEYTQYRFYHILIGSGLEADVTRIEGDIPGDCSIEIFLDNLEKELGIKS